MPYSPDLSYAFMDGHTRFMSLEREDCRMVMQIADLVLTTGKIVACDPLTLWNATPFKRTALPGHYPVLLTMTRFKKAASRTAFARVQFLPGQPVRWEMALKLGQSLRGLSSSEFHGYGVDTGTGCFMDEQAVALIKAKPDFNDMMMEEMLKEYPLNRWEHGNFILDGSSGLNLITFHSGWGDGSYPSFWGFNAEDKLLSLITDFGLISDDDEEETTGE